MTHVTPDQEKILAAWQQWHGKPMHIVGVRSGSDLDKSLYRLYNKLDLQDGIDVALWMEDHNVVYGPWIAGAQWLGFQSEEHVVEFVLTWL